eukprot:Skav220953  [mRNA]  locus=scaffold1928:44308:50743:+ [translate_table: standard]
MAQVGVRTASIAMLRFVLTLALVAARDCEIGAPEGNDASLAFVQLGQELLRAPKAEALPPQPPAAVVQAAPKAPRHFGGLKKAGEAAEAEAISQGLQKLGRYIYESLAYTTPLTEAAAQPYRQKP